MSIKRQYRISADSFIENNNAFDHIYNLYDNYSSNIWVEISIVPNWKMFLKKC